MRRLMGTVLFATALMGCGDPFGPDGNGRVRVTLDADGLQVTNGLSDTIYHAAIGENALILFAPCVRADCPRIAPGATMRISFAGIPAGSESNVIAFHWWQARSVGGQRVPGTVHTIRVEH